MKTFLFPALAIILTASTAVCAEDSNPPPPRAPRTFAHSERIRYDARCLTIEGKDTFIYSGAFHYFRCPKELWADRFQKIKDAGFNTVESYVAWNWHEREMPAGLDDFSKVNLTDLEDWLTMAEKFGLYVIIRPGPYICAEWNAGGFPQWLMTKKPAELGKRVWLRTDDATFLAWSKHWLDAVCPVIARHQITRKTPGAPGVILFQLENEYNYAKMPAAVMTNHVRALAQDALANGIDVPLFTCWTHLVRGSADPVLREVFDSCNFYPRFGVDGVRDDIEKLRREQPDAPLMTTELQGGWFSKPGGKLSEDQEGLTPAQIQNLTLFVIQNGETLLNYYMLFGGTNLDDGAGRDITATYDYAAPIREHGGVGERYARTWALGHLLREHGGRLARSEAVPLEVKAPDQDVQVALRRSPDGGRYYFVRTNQHDQPRKGIARVRETAEKAAGAELEIAYDLEPFGATVLYLPAGVTDPRKGDLLPRAMPAITRPPADELPKAVEMARTTRRDDPPPEKWMPLRSGQMLEDAGIYDSHFVYYRIPAAEKGQHYEFDVRDGDQERLAAPPVDGSDVTLLYENAGHPNGGAGMEVRGGIRSVRLLSNDQADRGAVNGWQLRKLKDASLDKTAEIALAAPSGGKTETWEPTEVSRVEASQLGEDESAVFRATLNLPAGGAPDGRTWLNFARVDDAGRIFVNGQLLGETAEWAQDYSFDAAKFLRPGENQILVAVKNGSGPGGLGPVILGGRPADGLPVQVASVERERGLAWSRPGFDDSGWQAANGGTKNGGAALLTWQRMEFTLPERKAGTWVPWHAHLEASGNGFVYLNGHCLGRYWEAGPQRDFFLPECWLNFGAGAKKRARDQPASAEKGCGDSRREGRAG